MLTTIFHKAIDYGIKKYFPKVIHDNILGEEIPIKNVKKLIIVGKSTIQNKTKFERLQDIQYLFTASKVTCGENTDYIFYGSKFNGGSNNCNYYNCLHWNTSNVQNMECMFENSPLENNPPF
jgi:hypothetical protein